MRPPYKKIISYAFTAGDEAFLITDWNDKFIDVEEVDKNGQEDTHFFGGLSYIGNRWKLEKDSYDHLSEYYSSETADALEEYINQHGPPSEDVPEVAGSTGMSFAGMDRNGEAEISLSVGFREGTVYVSRDTWDAMTNAWDTLAKDRLTDD